MTNPLTIQWEVTTTSRGAIIHQRVLDDNGAELLSHVIDLRNRQLRKHLIALGWTPPCLDPSRPLVVVAAEPDRVGPGMTRYKLECGHWVVRRTLSNKKSALCDVCIAFPGITQ